MVTKPKTPRGRPKKSTKVKPDEGSAPSDNLPPEDPVLQNAKPDSEDEEAQSVAPDTNVRLAHVEMLLSKQSDDMSVLAKERDELKAKVASLTLKVAALLRDKEQLLLELNSARKK